MRNKRFIVGKTKLNKAVILLIVATERNANGGQG